MFKIKKNPNPPKAIFGKCDACGGDILMGDMFVDAQLNHVSMQYTTVESLDDEGQERWREENRLKKERGDPNVNEPPFLAHIKDAEVLISVCLNCAERMALTEPIEPLEKASRVGDLARALSKKQEK